MQKGTGPRRVAVVMAGGGGERFWPLSRMYHPKQLLCLTSRTQTMLAEAVSRLTPLIPAEDVYVATARHLVDSIRAGKAGVPDANVIAEPCKRNTSGCLAYACAHLLATYGGPGASPESQSLQGSLLMCVVTADPLIGDVAAFRATLDLAMLAAAEHKAIVTIGIPPDRPETGYGYIEYPPDRTVVVHGNSGGVYPVTQFIEKPSREKAETLYRSGRHLWNSGMFFWTVETFLAELEGVCPSLAQATLAMAGAMQAGENDRVEAIFERLEDVSIDYALMERTHNILVARATFAWDDVGAWPALDRTYPHDDQGNVLVGDPVSINCRNCIVYQGGKEIAVAVIGAEDMVVVTTDDAVLVVPKDRAQDIKLAVAELKRRNAKQI